MGWKQNIAKINNNHCHVLIDDVFIDRYPIESLPILFYFRINCKLLPSTDAFWDPSESTILDNIENRLFHVLESHLPGWVVYLIRISSHGMRELYFHTIPEINPALVLDEMKNFFPDYSFDTDMKDDSRWEFYKMILNDITI